MFDGRVDELGRCLIGAADSAASIKFPRCSTPWIAQLAAKLETMQNLPAPEPTSSAAVQPASRNHAAPVRATLIGDQ